MQFKPAKQKLLYQLERIGAAYRLTSIGSTQLRFEGIDALEIYFSAGKGKVTHQPAALAEAARDHLIIETGLNTVTYVPPRNTQVLTALKDGEPGYILSRAVEIHGQPRRLRVQGTNSRKGWVRGPT